MTDLQSLTMGNCLQVQSNTHLAVGLWEANEVQLISLVSSKGSQAHQPLASIPLGTSHARSITAGPLGGHDTIFVGTSDGSVVFCPVPHADSPAESSPSQIRRVHAGSGGAMLHWVPERAGTHAHVYAQADRGLVIRERADRRTTSTPGEQGDVVSI